MALLNFVRKARKSKTMNPHELTTSMYGGPVDSAVLPATIPDDSFKEAQGSILFVERFFNHLLKSTKRGTEVKICITRSTSMACSLHQHAGEVFTIIVPLGVIARLRVLTRMLLEYWDQEKKVVILNSPLDKIAPDNWHIPSRMIPLFGQNMDQDDEKFWTGLAELDAMLSPAPESAQDVLELQHLALVHLIAHEFTHAWERHLSILKSNMSDVSLAPYDLHRKDLEKCIELHADIMAVELSTRILELQVHGADSDADVSLVRGFLRMGYMVTMLYSLYDPERKYLYAYDKDRYTHPLVRREMSIDFIRKIVSLLFPDMLDHVMENVKHGWMRCLWAINDMNLDAMSGKFGKIESGKLYFPIGLAMGGDASASYIAQEINTATNLVLRFVNLVKDLADEEYGKQ